MIEIKMRSPRIPISPTRRCWLQRDEADLQRRLLQVEGGYRHSGWTAGFAWSEVAGVVTLSDHATFERLTEPMLEDEFARMQPLTR